MKTVCVLFGGTSSEHEVSCMSAGSVLAHMDRQRYRVHMLGITKEGRWLLYEGPVEAVSSGEWARSEHLTPAVLSPTRGRGGLMVEDVSVAGGVRFEKIDAVFPVLHGRGGEDGTVQGLLELAGIPYVGSGVLGSALCMDKAVAHTLLTAAGVPKTGLIALHRGEAGEFEPVRARLEEELGYPMFVKPANAGSSVGVSKASDAPGLREAMRLAFLHDNKIVVEQAVSGREIECAVMGNENPVAADVLGEIVPRAEFYDYDAKYHDDSTDLRIPAELDADVARRVRETAVRAYRALECAGLARVDFFVRDSGEVVLNEINTIPGFTHISMYPKLFEASGVPYPELISRLIDYALERSDTNLL